MFVNVPDLYYHRHLESMVHRGSTSKSPKRTLPMPVYPPAKKSKTSAASWTEAEVVPKNLMMLSNAACPTQRGKASPNKTCHDITHSKNGNRFIQKHTCKYCLAKRIQELSEKKHLHIWDAVNILMREFRRYFCGFCLLKAFKTKDFSAISLGKKCFNGHGAISSMRNCDHGREFKYCKECKDPRAGGRYKVCGCPVISKCDCKVALGDEPMEAAVIAEKDAWVEASLERAQKMQAAGAITPKRRVVVVRTAAKPSIEEVLMQGVSGGELAAGDDTGASFAAAVLGGLKKGADFTEAGESDATTTTTPSVSAFGSPSGASSAFGSSSGASSAFGSPSGASSAFGSPLATISIQALIEPPADLPANYETESDGEKWVIDDRTESDSE
jgi:hypothetical protein